MVYVYILFSEQFDKYYVGQSIDVDNRIYQHNFDDSNSFTSKYRPWKLARSIPLPNRSSALKIERLIKKRKSKSFI